MPDIPAEAVRTVAEILRYWEVDASGEGDIAPVEEFDTDARELLEAAAPLIAEQARHEERAAITKLIRSHFAAADDPLYEDIRTLCGRIERGEHRAGDGHA
ncbi:hypothetical protein [Micrococcus luteus]|uniref:hypothetical protein n=1 Tax=Micrococcus luteus TaxID=1270 RepID=UPI00333266F1